MAQKNYTNAELARDYFIVSAQFSGDIRAYITQRKKISDLAVDLQTFYNEHGTLAELNIRGIGPTTIGTLELILEKGFEEAKTIVGERKREKIDKETQFGFRPKVPTYLAEASPSPGWENAVNTREGK